MEKKHYIIIAIVLLIAALLTYFLNREPSDAHKFVREYESINYDPIDDKEEVYIKVSVPEANPFIYKKAQDIVDMINNKETFIVYFGYSTSQYSRAVLPMLLEAARNTRTETIYYVDIKNIRLIKQVDKNGAAETIKIGTDAYYELLDLLDNVLDDYELESIDGKIITSGKNITAPTVVAIVNGEAKAMTSGISKKHTKANMEITDEIYQDSYNQFKEVLESINTNTCDNETSC
jgi:hypothetical protein